MSLVTDSSQAASTKRGGFSNGRLFHEPRNFTGDSDADDAVNWLNKMARLKKIAKLSDEEILFIACDHMVGKAELWFKVIGSGCTTWSAFEEAFKSHYLQDQEDVWWQQIHDIKQGAQYPTVSDVALKMQELFDLLGNKSQSFQVRTFLNAIKPDVACEVEKEKTPATFSEAQNKARQIERSMLKYGVASLGRNGVAEAPVVNRSSWENKSYQGISANSEISAGASSMFSLVDRLEKLSINLVNLTNAVTEKNGVPFANGSRVNVPNNNGGVRRPFTCFFCNKEGHKKYDCPDYLAQQRQLGAGVANNASTASGSNSLPLGDKQGKGKEYQA